MQNRDAFQNYMRYKSDAWAFLTECVYTMDQVSKEEPIKRFPDKEYLEMFVKCWQAYPLIANPKSRRMTMSWTTIGLYVWDTIFNKARHNAFVSKKEDDAHELVKRALFIVENLDKTRLLGEFIPKYTFKFNNLEFPEIMSKIQGFPQGADQLRAFTFSGIFGDESAFWEYAEKFYSASFPTLDGGGRMTLVSSPAPGFFKKLCFDAMGVPGDINVGEWTPDYKTPMEGVKIWVNKKNKFLVFELHYTADESKRDPSYKESIKASMPLQEYLREYELHWDTFSGQPVYPEFSKIHIIHNKPEPTHGLPMLIGFDFGLTPAAVVGQYDEGIFTVFEEFVEINMGAIRFLDKVTTELRLKYPTHSDFKKDWKCFIDPAGFNRNDNDERQTAQTVAKYFNPVPGAIAWETRRTSVVDLLMKPELGKPAFQIFSQGNPMLVKGFEGGYRFSDKNVDIEPAKLRPIKDSFSHCFVAGTKVRTARGELGIEDIVLGDMVESVDGYKEVDAVMNTNESPTLVIDFASGNSIECTPNHPIWTGSIFTRADALQYGDSVVMSPLWEEKQNTSTTRSTELRSIESQMAILRLTKKMVDSTYTDIYGSKQMGVLNKAFTFITSMKTKMITDLKTLLSCVQANITLCTPSSMLKGIQTQLASTWKKSELKLYYGMALKQVGNGTAVMLYELQRKLLYSNTHVLCVENAIMLKREQGRKVFAAQIAEVNTGDVLESMTKQEHAYTVRSLSRLTNTQKRDTVVGVRTTGKSKKVYDLTVRTTHCFYANNVLVGNCHDALQYVCGGVKGLKRSVLFNIPTPQYATSKGALNGRKVY